MSFYDKFLLILFIILSKELVFVLNQIRSKPLKDFYCEDVCSDGRNCFTNEWFVCKWKQLLNPSVICCFNRKSVPQSHQTIGQSSALSLQKFCPNNRRHYLTKRGIFSFLSGLVNFPPPMATNYPWVVSVLTFGQHICGGSVISDYVVLTAAHCFVPFFDSSVYSIRVGYNATNEGRLFSVSQVIRHELYFESESYHDIALIITTTAININARVDIACLPTPDMTKEQMVGRSGVVIGFGHEFYNRISLKSIQTRIFAPKDCSQMYAIGDKHNIPVGIQDCMICAAPLGAQDVVLGDSGGPLILINNGVQYVVGIVSFGRKSDSLKIPNVFTNVLYYRHWILNKLSQF